jgi:uncharacterized protein YndB with AHSA1/START domain/DNA-binding transcriptional ArsR family regulator
MTKPLEPEDTLGSADDPADAVFKALADPGRRRLLDRLAERDGRTLIDLEAALPQLSRFGVMKHLRVLEDAGLVVSHRVGREKHHYLNAVPLRDLHDRWLDRFTSRTARGLLDLRRTLEKEPTMSDHAPKHVYEILIRATPDQVWQGLTDPDMTERYYYGMRIEGALTTGTPYTYQGQGRTGIEGQVVEAVPGKRLVTTFRALFDENGRDEPASRVTYELEPNELGTLLRLIHDELADSPATSESVGGGWPGILFGLQSLFLDQAS